MRGSTRLRRALAEGATRVRVEIETMFLRGHNRTLIAELPGKGRADSQALAQVVQPDAERDLIGQRERGAILAACLLALA